MTQRLEVQGLSAGYGAALAVRDVTFSAAAGEVVVIVGSNGAGKTTTLSAVAGLVRPAAGRVRVDGVDVAGRPAHEVARHGACLVPDDRGLFSNLTVEEHLRMALRSGSRRHRRGSADRSDEVLGAFPRLADLMKRHCGLLSGGEQQMLAVAKALLMVPHVLLVDELSLGLAPVIVQEILPTVRRFADHWEMAVVLVEQHYELALAVADQALVLNHGAVVLAGRAADVRSDRGLLEAAYLGTT